MKLDQLYPLHESLNTVFDKIDPWKEYGDTLSTLGYFQDEVIKLEIELRPFMEKHVWANLAFARRLEDGSFTQELIGTGKKQGQILGSIRSALVDELQMLQKRVTIDALVAAVVQGEERRVSFYDKLLTSTITRIGGWGKIHTEIKLGSGSLLVVFADHLGAETRAKIIKSAQESTK